MLENGTLELAEIEGTNYYRLTEKGIEGAEKFKKLVPKSFRDKIYAAGLRLFVKLKNDRDVSFDNEIRVACRIWGRVAYGNIFFAESIAENKLSA